MIEEADHSLASSRRRDSLAGYRASDKWLLVQFAALWLALGGLLLFQLQKRPLARPEIEAVVQAASSLGQTLRDAHNFHQSPLFPLIASLLHPFGPEKALNVRFLSIFFGWLTLLPAYWLLRRATRLPTHAFLFALLFATSPFWIQMSRLAISHSLFALCAMAATAFLFRALEAPRWWWWCAYTLFITLMLYCDPLAPAVLVGHAAAALLRKHWTPERRTFGRVLMMFVCWAAALLLFAPWISVTVQQWRDLSEAHAAAGAGMPLYQQAGISTAYTLYMFMFGDSVTPWNALRAVLLSLPALIAAIFGLVRIFEHHHRTLRSVFICGFIAYAAAISATLVVFHDFSPLLVPLRLAFLYPFFCLAGAYGFGVMNKWLAVPLLAIILAVHGYSLRNYYEQREYTNWVYAVPVEETLGAIESYQTPRTLLAIDQPLLGQFDFFYRGKNLLSTSLEPWPDAAKMLAQEAKPYDRLLVLRPGGKQPEQPALAQEFTLVQTLQFMREDAVENEVKMFLAGREIPQVKYCLEVYDKQKNVK